MTSFAADWLTHREPVDARSRNGDVADAIAAWFTLRDSIAVVDLGCGTGSNLRATSALLPAQQDWVLVDHDRALLDVARQKLGDWADTTETLADDRQRLTKNDQTITVRFQLHDLSTGIAPLLEHKPNLVTASALFDLTSTSFIKESIKTIAVAKAAFLGLLTYDGRQRWTPPRPADQQIVAAFNRHQMRDKGFGEAAGPTAAALLVDQLRINEYSVVEGDSPWQLTVRDKVLLNELVESTARAAREAGLDDATVERWRGIQHTATIIGHTDIFATLR